MLASVNVCLHCVIGMLKRALRFMQNNKMGVNAGKLSLFYEIVFILVQTRINTKNNNGYLCLVELKNNFCRFKVDKPQ